MQDGDLFKKLHPAEPLRRVWCHRILRTERLRRALGWNDQSSVPSIPWLGRHSSLVTLFRESRI